MTISTQQVDVAQKFPHEMIADLILEIDHHLFKSGVIASSVCSLREIPDQVAHYIAGLYRNQGWKVNFSTKKTNDYCEIGRTTFVFLR